MDPSQYTTPVDGRAAEFMGRPVLHNSFPIFGTGFDEGEGS